MVTNARNAVALFGLAVSLVAVPAAWAQSRGAQRPVQGSQPGTGTGTPAAAETGTLVVRSVNLSRSAIDGAAQQRPAGTSGSTAPRKRTFLQTVVSNTVNGDEARQRAAQEVLEAEASSEAGRGRTVVVVIGGDADRDKVRDSLAAVQRPVTLLYVDSSLSDQSTDNAALIAGLAGSVKSLATNLWVYLPSMGDSHRRRPNQVLGSRVATPTLWTGLFALDGDTPPQLTNALNGQGFRSNNDGARDGETAAAISAPSPSSDGPVAKAVGTVAEGDVLTPKIAGVKLFVQPTDSAAVLAALAKTDQVVVIGGERNGYVNVEGASGRGWVNAKLFIKN